MSRDAKAESAICGICSDISYKTHLSSHNAIATFQPTIVLAENIIMVNSWIPSPLIYDDFMLYSAGQCFYPNALLFFPPTNVSLHDVSSFAIHNNRES